MIELQFYWPCHKSHLFHDKPNRVKSCRWQGISINIFLFTNETCGSWHPH